MHALRADDAQYMLVVVIRSGVLVCGRYDTKFSGTLGYARLNVLTLSADSASPIQIASVLILLIWSWKHFFLVYVDFVVRVRTASGLSLNQAIDLVGAYWPLFLLAHWAGENDFTSHFDNLKAAFLKQG